MLHRPPYLSEHTDEVLAELGLDATQMAALRGRGVVQPGFQTMSHFTSMNTMATKDPRFSLRFATPDDAGLLLDFMHQLGTFQKMRDKIVATETGLRQLLTQGKGEAIFGDYDGKTVGFAYFCQTSSAFIGQSGLYIDGFLVSESMRGKGLGKIMMAFMAKLALARGCLDWNEPSIQFYRKLGAQSVDIMTIYRFGPEQLKVNAALF